MLFGIISLNQKQDLVAICFVCLDFLLKFGVIFFVIDFRSTQAVEGLTYCLASLPWTSRVLLHAQPSTDIS